MYLGLPRSSHNVSPSFLHLFRSSNLNATNEFTCEIRHDAIDVPHAALTVTATMSLRPQAACSPLSRAFRPRLTTTSRLPPSPPPPLLRFEIPRHPRRRCPLVKHHHLPTGFNSWWAPLLPLRRAASTAGDHYHSPPPYQIGSYAMNRYSETTSPVFFSMCQMV